MEWREPIERRLEMYAIIRAATAHVNAVVSTAVSERLVVAGVTWRMDDRTGTPLYEFSAVYTLVHIDGGFRIAAIAHDEVPKLRRAAAGVQGGLPATTRR